MPQGQSVSMRQKTRTGTRHTAAGRSDGEIAIEEVRRVVARELHDRVVQTLTCMLIDVENFKSQPVGWDDVVHEMDTIQGSTRHVLNNIRQVLHDLRGND